jgi:hypothetical protein
VKLEPPIELHVLRRPEVAEHEPHCALQVVDAA